MDFYKRAFLFLFFSFFCTTIFSQVSDGIFVNGVPKEFDGIWEGKDRLVMFSDGTNILSSQASANYASIYLKTYYGWYVDRTAEPRSFSSTTQDSGRTRNACTVNFAEEIEIKYRPIILETVIQNGKEEATGSVWELFILYPKKRERVVVPVCVIEDKIYLNFAIKLDGFDKENQLNGFWCGIGESNGIKVSEPVIKDNIDSIYVTEDAVYHIRYWKTDMEYSSAQAFFSDGKKTYNVVKHIRSAGQTYTCVNGRSVTIRNVQKTNEKLKDYVLDKSGGLCAFGKPYLIRIKDKASVQEVLSIVKTANLRRAPYPNPPFAPSDLDWHLDEIRYLEKDNELIKAVRKRQKEFARQALKP